MSYTTEHAHVLRNRIIEVLTNNSTITKLRKFSQDGNEFASVIADGLESEFETICDDMSNISLFDEEHWSINTDGSVKLVSENDFNGLPPENRFSKSGCMRKVPNEALGIRAVVSALKSQEVSSAISEALGESVSWKSSDIARYHHGSYLRAHSDTFEDRRIGLVFFANTGWNPGFGGELVVTSPSGITKVVAPIGGRIAAIRIRDGYTHQVAEMLDSSWNRLSIANHFAV